MSKPAPFLLRGVEIGAPTKPVTQQVQITNARRVQTGAVARDAGATPLRIAPDELVRVEYDNGIRLWLRADDLLRERGRAVASRSAGGEPTWDIDTAPRAGLRGDGQATRGGLVGVGIKVLEFFGVDVADEVAGKAAGAFEHHQLKGNAPGLYTCPLAAGQPLKRVDPKHGLPGRTPLLVFLHGTMSSFRGSFGDLEADPTADASAPAREAGLALRQKYGEHIYAWEHLTLTQSPIRNALDLVRLLPEEAELHLVSHSRGGLVGELLCLAERQRTDDPLATGVLEALFAEDRTLAQQLGLLPLSEAERRARAEAYANDAKDLRELLALLDAKRLRVHRFVRVACPARGTTLASGRLDRWLSVLDALAGGGFFGAAADFLLAVLSKRTDPRTMPGIEAMMPGSALTRLLALPGLVTTADLSVIAGDVEGDSLFGKLKFLVTDWFYGSEHDLVVNTGSMSGGLRRVEGAARWLQDRGPQVNHFRYFANPGSLRWLASGLLRADGDAGGFSPFTEAKVDAPKWRGAVERSRSGDTPRPIVVVIPGTMGSELKAGDSRIWLNYWSLLRGGLADIGWGTPEVRPMELVDDFYGPLLEHLARDHRVEIFPYDWRRSLQDTAPLLTKKLLALLPDAERTGKPLHIIAHSMGGLVARTMIASKDGALVWQRMGKLAGGSRLLMLGTPNRGSHEAVRWLTGHNPTQAKLTLLDLKHNTNAIIDIVRRFPGMAELLPFTPDPIDFSDPAGWRALKKSLRTEFPLADPSTLKDAAATWALLQKAAPDTERMRYVAGSQSATVVGYTIPPDDGSPGPRRIDWLATAEGDGTVSWASGRLDGVRMYYAEDTAHDELCSNADDRRIFRAYVDLLATGRTDQLPDTPPRRARDAQGRPATFTLPPLAPTDDLPDEAAVRSMGFSGARRRVRREVAQLPPLNLSVRLADLAWARHAVLVGHYEGDTIVSAEAVLDRRLSGALSRKRDLGLYPGPHGTHAVFFQDDPSRSPSGAVVVGLGPVGDLAAARLQASLRDAMLEYALRLVQRPGTGAEAAGGRIPARLSCLLVGSSGAGLSVRESVEAILRAALGANRRLEETHLDSRVLITEIEFIELFEDMAIAAARALADVLQATEIGRTAIWAPPTVTEGPGRRQRRFYDTDRSWDQRIEITEDDETGQLRFNVATNRARTEETLATGQLKLADLFVKRASEGADSDPEVSRTLFELLLPQGFKASAPDQRDMVLQVDEKSARFPWELLEDRWSRNGLPLAIEAGIVRQFKVRDWRVRPMQALADTALVIGNPDLEGDAVFPDLEGARQEAGVVRDLLLRHYAAGNVVALIDAKAADIVSALHSKAWRVLHLAGHGEHEFVAENGDKPVSGMVIGRGTFLTPGDVAQMRCVPELVFINCCHLGKTQTSRPLPPFSHLAANLGAQFIGMGVKAVVCAGWAVDDEAAMTFARSFYAAMFGGHSFRDAVKAARRATHQGHPGRNTWGAYQCYGDPAWRIERNGGVGGGWDEPEFVSRHELLAELENLAEAARVMSGREGQSEDAVGTRQRAAIDRLLQQRVPASAREGWLARADVCAGVGFAYGEALLFKDAIEWLDKALSARGGDCPVRALEQAVNMRVRIAAEEGAALIRRKESTRDELDKVTQRIEEAIPALDFINSRAPTPERLQLLGSACKRLAWLRTDPAQRVEELLRMARYYRMALDLLRGDDAYAMSNWGVACLLVQHQAPDEAEGDWHDALAEQLSEQAKRSAERQATDPSFWGAVSLADLGLVRLLLAKFDADACLAAGEQAAEGYGAAMARGASPREAGSVREHLDFLIALTEDWPDAVHQALQTVREALL